jgi:anti-sigma regulatory factor (Ser/Thr protein kinase)
MADRGTTTTSRLELQPHPSAASVARRWVREQLRTAGDDALVESAELATSELVTNAVVHARTTVTVTLQSREASCRISVQDRSLASLVVVGQEPGEVWSSGRGLQILASIVRRWGVEENPSGKAVWFEPSDSVGGGDHQELTTPSRRRASARSAQLRQAPVTLLRQARQRFADLHREMLMIVFGRDDDVDGPSAAPQERSDMPDRLVELAHAIEPLTDGLFPPDLCPTPRKAREDAATLSCPLPDAGTHLDLASWPDLLDEADEYCRSEQLLALAAPRREAQARRWFLTEVARQSTGGPPRSWPDYLDAGR